MGEHQRQQVRSAILREVSGAMCVTAIAEAIGWQEDLPLVVSVLNDMKKAGEVSRKVTFKRRKLWSVTAPTSPPSPAAQ